MSRTMQAMPESRPAESPQWSLRKLLTMALTALVVMVALPLLMHHLMPLVSMPHPLRVCLAAMVLATTVLSCLLAVTWLTLALARSIRNL